MGRPEVFALVPELLAGIRVHEAAKAAGAGIRLLETEAELRSALASGTPALVVVDLGYHGIDGEAAVAAASAAGARVIAFGPHVQEERLEAGRQAGADRVYRRGRFLRQVAAILREHLAEQPRRPASAG
jgi:DNA-binding response OmpR family regulator